MADKSVNKYRLYCKTEQAYGFVWNDTTPTACPNSAAHTIDTSTISVVDSVTSKSVNIIQEGGTTGGNYSCETRSFTVPANTTQNNDYTWPYNISISCVRFRSNTTHKGDFVTSLIAPNTTLGALTADAAIGSTTFQVSASVLQNIKIGMQVTITDGQGNNNVVDRVYQINQATNSIT